MPKEIKSAADILGEEAPETETGAPTAEIPSAEPAEVAAQAAEKAAAEVEEKKPGFEAPPPPVEEEKSAAQLLTASGSLAQNAPPPPTAVATMAKEAVIPAKPETIAPVETQEISPAPVVAPVAKKVWHFVKNVHFGEKIFLKDKTQFLYSSPSFSVADPELAAKILEVAGIYNIVEK